MKRLAVIVVAAGVLWGSSPAAIANDHYTYKNPTKPTKTAAKLKDSQYIGWHYEKRWEGYRKCVMARESGGNYKANGRYGSGAYQFIQSTWDSAMRQANKPEWIGVRPHKAPPYIQDEAFFVMANPYPKRKGLHGKHHWSSSHAATFGFRTFEC